MDRLDDLIDAVAEIKVAIMGTMDHPERGMIYRLNQLEANNKKAQALIWKLLLGFFGAMGTAVAGLIG